MLNDLLIIAQIIGLALFWYRFCWLFCPACDPQVENGSLSSDHVVNPLACSPIVIDAIDIFFGF